MYSIRGSLKHRYYLQTRNIMVRLISCLLDSNRNSKGEYVRVSRNWLYGEMTCPTFPRQIGQYFFYQTLYTPKPSPHLLLFSFLLLSLLFLFFIFYFFLLTCSRLFALHSFHCLFHLLLILTTFLTVVPKKFQPDIKVVCAKELNFHSSLGDFCALR